MDNPNLEDYNVDQKVEKFINYTLDQAKSYKTNNLIMTMGSDFQYSNAHRWFKNLDKLIYYVNQAQSKGSKVNIFYSTTACYLYSLNQANTTWTVKYDDFFPYAHRPHAFWTGYFTSRAAFKSFVRRSNNFLQSIRHLALLANLNDDETINSIVKLERAMGVAQHHDAVSGTERQHVANDYSKRLSEGINDCVNIIYKAFNNILMNRFGLKEPNLQLSYCSLLNISQCNPIEDVDHFTLVVYNPLARRTKTYLNIPVETNDFVVFEAKSGIQIFSESTNVYYETMQIPERTSRAKFNLIFQAKLPPMGFQVFSINRKSHSSLIKKPKINSKALLIEKDDKILIKNQYLQLTFDLEGNI
jgi:lysosomal alpha-mannosidase